MQVSVKRFPKQYPLTVQVELFSVIQRGKTSLLSFWLELRLKKAESKKKRKDRQTDREASD